MDLVLWGAAGLCVALTLWLSLIEVPPGTSAFGGADKVEHAFAYFVTSLYASTRSAAIRFFLQSPWESESVDWAI